MLFGLSLFLLFSLKKAFFAQEGNNSIYLRLEPTYSVGYVPHVWGICFTFRV
jgi:hypothetical protein